MGAESAAPRFSIVVLTRNEARTLPRLLASLAHFIDRGGEVVVVDTGSADETVAVARAGGCRVEVVNRRFESVLHTAGAARIDKRFARADEAPLVMAGQRLFHFGEARQYAGLAATHHVVLQLDASDEVLALDLDVLGRHLASGAPGGFAYDLLTGNVRLRVTRFYDRTRYRWVGRAHETLTAIEDRNPSSTIRCDPAALLVRHHKDEGKVRPYLAGLALQTMERPDEPRWWHYLGRELYYDQKYHSAIAALDTHAAMDTAWPAERAQSRCFAAECFEALGQMDAAKEACSRAIALDSTRREPLLRLAALHSRLGEFEDAVACARRSLEVPHTSGYPELDANYTWVPHSLLYWGLFWLGRHHEAREHWETCAALMPDDVTIRHHARLFQVSR